MCVLWYFSGRAWSAVESGSAAYCVAGELAMRSAAVNFPLLTAVLPAGQFPDYLPAV